MDELREVAGAEHVHVSGDLCQYEQDWRRRIRGRALAVVRPKNTGEVAALVKVCARHGISIVPQGGNTGLVGGSIPDASGNQVVLQLGRMSRVRHLDSHNLTVTVDAGVILQSLQTQMHEAGYLFPLSLGAEGSCMIGGNLATNAGGTQVLRYGNMRDLCLGLEVVTPDGDVWEGLSGLRKDNTGYDLRNLFIGSEGTLGVITAATLKIFPLPAAVLTAWVALPSLEDGIKLLGLTQRKLGASLTGFEVMGHAGLELVARHMPQFRIPFLDQRAPYCVLIECSDTESEERAREALERLLESVFDEGRIIDAVIADNLAQAEQLWHIREHITLAQTEEGPNVKHDVSIPISEIPAFASTMERQLTDAFPGLRIINFGHLGDGNLHYNVQCPQGANALEFIAAHEGEIMDLVYRCVHDHGGSFSAEHGVGALKVGTLQEYKSHAALRLMRAIKTAFDPHNLMNPGRVLPSCDLSHQLGG